MAIVRLTSNVTEFNRLEYPTGATLLKSSWEHPLSAPRISPRGDHVAVLVGRWGGDGGDVVVLDRSGRQTSLSTGWMEVDVLAWSPDAQEVWFTAEGPRSENSAIGAVKELHAVSLAGRDRLLLRMAGDLTLADVFRDGRVLLSHGRARGECRGKLAGDEKERDLTYLDGTLAVGISADGRAVLFQEEGQAGGPQTTAYLRRVGDAGPIRLGEGWALALSPDGKRAVVGSSNLFRSGSRFTLFSTGAEPPVDLPRGGLDRVGWAYWTPDGQQLVFMGWGKDGDQRCYIQRPPDGLPHAITPSGTGCEAAPSQQWASCFHLQEKDGRAVPVRELRSLNGSETRPTPWLGEHEVVIGWSPDGQTAFVASQQMPPFRVFRIDAATGRRESWLETSPPDPAGVIPLHVSGAPLTPDGRYYAYSYLRTLSDLFLVEGLR